MNFMNGPEIESLYERYGRINSPAGTAVRFLYVYMNEVNMHSDGWPYWRPPVQAASKLIDLCKVPGDITESKLKAALTPIKAFYTRRGNAAGMQWPEVQS